MLRIITDDDGKTFNHLPEQEARELYATFCDLDCSLYNMSHKDILLTAINALAVLSKVLPPVRQAQEGER